MILAKILGSIKAKLYDSAGNAIDSEVVGSQRALIVKDVGGGGGNLATEDTLAEILRHLIGNNPRKDLHRRLEVMVKNPSTDGVNVAGDLDSIKNFGGMRGYWYSYVASLNAHYNQRGT